MNEPHYVSSVTSDPCSLVLLQAWRDEGLTLSTSSNEACKLYDAILTQVPTSNTYSILCLLCAHTVI